MHYFSGLLMRGEKVLIFSGVIESGKIIAAL